MNSCSVNVSLMPSLQLSISLSMDYLAHLNHREPENLWVLSARTKSKLL